MYLYKMFKILLIFVSTEIMKRMKKKKTQLYLESLSELIN